MAYENVILEQVEPGIYRLTINRPKALNALNAETLDEIEAALREVEADPGARALLVTGAGDKAFVAGADISQMRSLTAAEAKAFALKGQKVFRRLEDLPVPVIAVVNGYCLGGGCELAMACDWIVASEKAVFGQPEVNLGVTPGFGGTQRLTRIVGKARAMELVTTGRQVKAAEAKEIGLVNHVVPADALMDEALAQARTVASKGPVAVRLAKEAVQRGQDLDLDNACVLESDVFGLCFATEDQKEGMAAFLEKRKAAFQGR
ncbi:MAG: enoyl-CoA hydratase/isomerase family protein [Deltaproteobacteria bacterium]|nr:enoyl-CoA hydratase/isomerase family protein [Deltaproteobacteria bacterium]